jgi:acetyl-CoA carboxylase carboxyltransferase component
VFEDVPGFLPGTDQEWHGIITNGAKLLFLTFGSRIKKFVSIVLNS